MKHTLLLVLLISLNPVFHKNTTVEVGKKIPEYTFKEVLNANQKPFVLNDINKPVIIEFWATWCSPCIPAMKKLEALQNKYGDALEIITVSTDSKENLNRYIKSTNTPLRVAFDTTHLSTFPYRYIPHTILIDKNGIVQAITTPQKLTEHVVSALLEGKKIVLPEEVAPEMEFSLNQTFKNKGYQYKLTSRNKNLTFKNEIKRDADNKAVSLNFQNVSIYRLMTDIYELSSAARIYSEESISTETKYCFSLEQNSTYEKDLLQNAREILNTHLDIQANMIEKEMDSVYVLEITDTGKLPAPSTAEKKFYEYRGPYYQGKKVSAYNLIEYLENEVQQPIKNKTQLNYLFDIELDWSYTDGKTLNHALEKYGLRISKSEQPEKLTLLELSKQ